MTNCLYCERETLAREMCGLHYRRWYEKNRDEAKHIKKKAFCERCGRDLTDRSYQTRARHRSGKCKEIKLL